MSQCPRCYRSLRFEVLDRAQGYHYIECMEDELMSFEEMDQMVYDTGTTEEKVESETTWQEDCSNSTQRREQLNSEEPGLSLEQDLRVRSFPEEYQTQEENIFCILRREQMNREKEITQQEILPQVSKGIPKLLIGFVLLMVTVVVLMLSGCSEKLTTEQIIAKRKESACVHGNARRYLNNLGFYEDHSFALITFSFYSCYNRSWGMYAARGGRSYCHKSLRGQKLKFYCSLTCDEGCLSIEDMALELRE